MLTNINDIFQVACKDKSDTQCFEWIEEMSSNLEPRHKMYMFMNQPSLYNLKNVAFSDTMSWRGYNWTKWARKNKNFILFQGDDREYQNCWEDIIMWSDVELRNDNDPWINQEVDEVVHTSLMRGYLHIAFKYYGMNDIKFKGNVLAKLFLIDNTIYYIRKI